MIASCAQALAKLSAPHGKLAVLGNHDYWVDAEGVSRALTETAGFQVLRNESATLMVGESVLTVVGLDDPYTHHGDFAQAMSGIPGGSPTVLLAHDPDIIEQAAARGISLVLAGHTHGGQVVVPGLGPPIPNSRYGQRYVSGLNHCRATAIYTNRGIGMVLVPLRIACPPEVAVIALRPEAISATRLPGRSPARRQPSGR
jgi:predicted MPP superfamily phosphohydrolase